MPYRVCEKCGKRHLQANSPICGKCRHAASKRKCPIDGCEELINSGAKTCLKHRPLQKGMTYTHCRECGREFSKANRRGVCDECLANTRVLCACGCGRYRRKYGKAGQIFQYVSGHNDNYVDSRRPLVACAVCGKQFKAATPRTKLCSLECRAKWSAINPVYERKRVLVQCAACGKDIYRAPHEMKPDVAYACSKECRYTIVANKLSGPKSSTRRFALQRDEYKCKVCGFDIIVEVHHIRGKRRNGGGGTDELDNLITLCPNHHTMADRGMISEEELKRYIADMAQ